MVRFFADRTFQIRFDPSKDLDIKRDADPSAVRGLMERAAGWSDKFSSGSKNFL